MAVYVADHPLIRHKLGLLRKQDLSTKHFRELASEIARLLTYEATKDLPTERKTVQGWAGPVEVETIKGKKITVVPILRAGLGMQDGVLDLIPSAKLSIVGFYRDESTLQPIQYYAKLAKNIGARMALILDPMLATGVSSSWALKLVKKAGGRQISLMCLIAAPEGVKFIQKNHPDVKVFTAALDERLNDHAYIIPGLGDAGDRLYRTK